MGDPNAWPFVTGIQLCEGGPAFAAWFQAQPNIWRADGNADVLWNLAHPSNRRRLLEGLITEARNKGIV